MGATAESIKGERVRYGSRDAVAGCSTLNLRRAARAASHILDQHLTPTGLRSTQFGMLSAINKLGVTHMTALADYLVIDRTTLTRNLAVLERDGFVSLEPGEDRRVREIALTKLGHDRLEGARPYWAAGEAAIRTHLGAERWETLISLLRDVAALPDNLVRIEP